MWCAVIRSSGVPPRAIVAVDVAGDEAVVWRTRDGRPCAVARQCPHLDSDLVDGALVGDDLLCLAHGWTIRPDGRACKRNERGRVDDKGTTRAWSLRDRDGWIEADVT